MSVGILWEFAILPGVYILLPLQEEEVLRKKRCTLPPEGADVYIQQHIHQKDLNLCLPLHDYAKVIVELEKTQTRNSAVLWYL